MSSRRFVVIAGPETIGNIFGRYGLAVPEGKFVVAESDEYSNGGWGPSIVMEATHPTAEEAEAAGKAWEARVNAGVNRKTGFSITVSYNKKDFSSPEGGEVTYYGEFPYFSPDRVGTPCEIPAGAKVVKTFASLEEAMAATSW